MRRLLHRLHNELKLPVYCLLDNDPWGYYIYSVIKQGSINLAYESQRMAIPDAKYLGLRSNDFERCELSDSVKITLNDTDRKRAKQIANYPWFEHKKAWQKEIKQMLDQRLQAGSRSADQQGHQLRDRGVRAGAAAAPRLAGLKRCSDLHHPLANFGGQDEDLAVAHAAGAGDFDDLADDLLETGVVDPEVDLHLGQKGERVFAALILVEIALLSAVAFDFANADTPPTALA